MTEVALKQSTTSPVYAYLKQPSMVDYPGQLAGVFFTAGCNFTCGFCHNVELLGKYIEGIPWLELESACKNFRENWVEAVVISGGEPTLHKNLPELISFFRNFSFKIKLDTNGSNPQMLASIIDQIDYVAMDVKTSLNNYPALVKYSDSESLVSSIEIIKSKAKDYEFRTTIIEGIHDDETLNEMLPLIKESKRFVIQPFIPRDNLPDTNLRSHLRTSKDYLEHCVKVFSSSAKDVQLRNN